MRGPWRDERGVATIEFALVRPVLVLMLFGIIQMSATLFVQNNMGPPMRPHLPQVS